jgi:SAM-dependent methyltransferase
MVGSKKVCSSGVHVVERKGAVELASSHTLFNWNDPSFQEHRSLRTQHWDDLAVLLDHWRGWGGAYHQRLEKVYGYLVPSNKRVLELGCGEGNLLAALNPSVGIGVDLSSKMLQRAQKLHPELIFVQADGHSLPLTGVFDFIILSDLINEVWDLQTVLREILRIVHPRTRLIINSYSRMWEIPLAIAEKLGLAKPSLNLNWLTVQDVINLLELEGFAPVRHWEEILFPLPIPFLSTLFNHVLVRLWPFRLFALTNFIVARPVLATSPDQGKPTVSVIVPARNEAGNISEIFNRTPEMGGGTELVFVEGHSTDNTYEVIEREIDAHPERASLLFRQPGEGKGDAVRVGFDQASGDILLILDADLTVPPEDLPRFYEVLCTGKGDFVNGVRLVYPMEDEAMRFLNLIGNKFFSLGFSWLIGQNIKDTLCGTKGLWKQDYEVIAANRDYFGDFDPFGDFDLILGAARLTMKIVDLPIRYRQRSYGVTNVRRWEHGLLLLKMLVFAARRLKFI